MQLKLINNDINHEFIGNAFVLPFSKHRDFSVGYGKEALIAPCNMGCFLVRLDSLNELNRPFNHNESDPFEFLEIALDFEGNPSKNFVRLYHQTEFDSPPIRPILVDLYEGNESGDLTYSDKYYIPRCYNFRTRVLLTDVIIWSLCRKIFMFRLKSRFVDDKGVVNPMNDPMRPMEYLNPFEYHLSLLRKELKNQQRSQHFYLSEEEYEEILNEVK